MNRVILAMTKSQHQSIQRVLFPGDGLEAAAILVCNQGNGFGKTRLIVSHMISLPHEQSLRAVNSVTWPLEKYLLPDTISDIDSKRQCIVTIHSHPSAQTEFSTIDDDNDNRIFDCIQHWFSDQRLNGSAIMVPDGRVRARIFAATGDYQDVENVAAIGDDIEIWTCHEPEEQTGYEDKIAQTFGKGTLDLLRSLTVGVVGCSGTGSILVELLVRNCIGQVHLIDDDVVKEKNLNRILNSTQLSATQQHSKVDTLENAIHAMGMGTRVRTFKGVTDRRDVLQALIDCDVIFGAVDSAYGRYHLDCIASAYCLPYFDVGVHLEVDVQGEILAADAVSHYVQPEGSTLLARNAYTMDQVTAENYYRNNREYYDRNRVAGYLAAIGEDQPAVMSINMQASCMAFNDFLARVHRFRLDNNREFATQRIRMVHGHYECEADQMSPHALFKSYIGSGDASLLVRNNLIDA